MLQSLATAMAARGRRVVVLTGESNPEESGLFQVVTTDLLNLENHRSGRLQIEGLASRFSSLLARLIETHQIGIVHGHNLHHFNSAPALAIDEARRAFDLGVFHTFHETWPDLLREQPVYRLWRGNYAVSRHIEEQCRTLLGFSPMLLHLGVDTDRFCSKTECFSSGSRPTILHPARLLPWKGVETSLRALRWLIDKGHDATLMLTDTQRIADWNRELTDYRRRILHLMDELQLSSHVVMVTASHQEMPALYERADIVIYPTVGEEPYGLVPVEAMSCSRPIIATNSGGIPETVSDGVTGYIVEKGDAAALATQLSKLISDPVLARRLGAAGRRRAVEMFDETRYVSTLLEHFDAA